MNYLGLDVHSQSTVWTVVDEAREVTDRGKAPTTADGLAGLVARWPAGELLVGQEVGSMACFVHDVVTGAGAKILSPARATSHTRPV